MHQAHVHLRNGSDVLACPVQREEVRGISFAAHCLATLVLVSAPPHPIGQQSDGSADDRSQQGKQRSRPIHSGIVPAMGRSLPDAQPNSSNTCERGIKSRCGKAWTWFLIRVRRRTRWAVRTTCGRSNSNAPPATSGRPDPFQSPSLLQAYDNIARAHDGHRAFDHHARRPPGHRRIRLPGRHLTVSSRN